MQVLRSGNRDIKINILPLSLKELFLPRYHLYKTECFPPNLLNLQLSYYYNYELAELNLIRSQTKTSSFTSNIFNTET